MAVRTRPFKGNSPRLRLALAELALIQFEPRRVRHQIKMKSYLLLFLVDQ
jgi:hypothetical protein